MRQLPRALEDLQVATPCLIEWASLPGDAQRRHCDRCDKDVVDVAGFTRWEAEQLLLGFQERHCLRVGRLASGLVVTLDTLPGAHGRASINAGRRLVLATLGLCVGVALAVLATLRPPHATAPPPEPPPGPPPRPPREVTVVIPAGLTIGVGK